MAASWRWIMECQVASKRSPSEAGDFKVCNPILVIGKAFSKTFKTPRHFQLSVCSSKRFLWHKGNPPKTATISGCWKSNIPKPGHKFKKKFFFLIYKQKAKLFWGYLDLNPKAYYQLHSPVSFWPGDLCSRDHWLTCRHSASAFLYTAWWLPHILLLYSVAKPL